MLDLANVAYYLTFPFPIFNAEINVMIDNKIAIKEA